MSRDEFFSWLGKFIKTHNVQVAPPEPMEDEIIISTPVADWNPENNRYWHNPANKSYPRDVWCEGKCKLQMVMSDGAYARLMRSHGKTKVMCIWCATEYAKKEKSA